MPRDVRTSGQASVDVPSTNCKISKPLAVYVGSYLGLLVFLWLAARVAL